MPGVIAALEAPFHFPPTLLHPKHHETSQELDPKCVAAASDKFEDTLVEPIHVHEHVERNAILWENIVRTEPDRRRHFIPRDSVEFLPAIAGFSARANNITYVWRAVVEIGNRLPDLAAAGQIATNRLIVAFAHDLQS
jgi:hypothetical protein